VADNTPDQRIVYSNKPIYRVVNNFSDGHQLQSYGLPR
jgi:hypothetical protein